MNRMQRLRTSDFIMGLTDIISLVPYWFFLLVVNPLVKQGRYGNLIQGLVPYPPEPQTMRARVSLRLFHMISSGCRGLVAILVHIDRSKRG